MTVEFLLYCAVLEKELFLPNVGRQTILLDIEECLFIEVDIINKIMKI